MKADLVRGAKKIDEVEITGVSSRKGKKGHALLIEGVDSEEAVKQTLEILAQPDSERASIAYLFYGIVNSEEGYAFYDLNDLPDNVSVRIEVMVGEEVMTVTRFKGKLGNSPEPVVAG